MMERKSINYALFIGTLSILGVMVFSPQIVYAPSHPVFAETGEPNILPDSIFWGVKLAIETIQENFTFQDDRKAELIIKHSEERDREAQALERQGKMIPLERLKAIQAEKLKRAEVIIIKLERAQNIIEQEERDVADRREIGQARNEQERLTIQMAQQNRDRASNLIEAEIGVSTLIEPLSKRIADRPVTIIPVNDIEESDDRKTILMKLRDRLENSFSSSEITEIRAKFAEVRDESDPIRKQILAESLDEKVNSPLVGITCLGRVNTLSLSVATDPVRELQDQCPILRPFPTDMIRDVVIGGS